MNIASLLQGLASLAWLLAIGALGFAVFNAARGRRFAGGAALLVGAMVAAVVLTIVAAGLVFIEPDERGVVISALDPKGYRDQALTPGLRWVIPFAERVQKYTISRQTYTMSATAAEGQVEADDSIRARTKDGQEVFVDASVIYAIDPDKVVALHITWQSRYQDEVIRPLSRGIIRDIASQYGVEEIVSTERVAMEQLITEELARKLADNDLELGDFVLRDIHFSDEYAAAVEQKQIAEQQAQQAALVVEQKKQEAEQARQVAQGQADAAVIAARGAAQARVIQAEAEAEALRLINESLKNNPDLLTYRYIEKLSPNVQVMYLPSNSPYLIPLPTAPAPTVASTTVVTSTTP
ncbi:MAG TPA: SPFH domain-containing protein [Anaerolineales bacterium]|nr:SPFH domain-containing protein [Anaerolineales bacterium]